MPGEEYVVGPLSGPTRCTCGSSPCRDTAWMTPWCPASSSDSTVSTMVRPVPMSSTVSRGSTPRSACAAHGERR
ncbi:hypothetical protein ACLESD_44575 [Pyxidicoccus sp. 3LFB2]